MIPLLRKKVYPPGCLLGGYEIIRVIGEGRFGICYLVNSAKKQYVLKELKPREIKKSRAKVIFEEKILLSINHPSIPKIIDTINDNKIYAYILEYKNGQTVENLLFGENHIFSYNEIYKIAAELISIIKYLHEKNIVHRDIRIPNVIINKEEVYLIDFGLARFINNEKYSPSADFSYLGHLLLHLYYSSFNKTSRKSRPWYEELELSEKENIFLKKLLGINEGYNNITDIENDFFEIYAVFHGK